MRVVFAKPKPSSSLKLLEERELPTPSTSYLESKFFEVPREKKKRTWSNLKELLNDWAKEDSLANEEGKNARRRIISAETVRVFYHKWQVDSLDPFEQTFERTLAYRCPRYTCGIRVYVDVGGVGAFSSTI